MTKELRLAGIVNAAVLGFIFTINAVQEFVAGNQFCGYLGDVAVLACIYNVISFKKASVL